MKDYQVGPRERRYQGITARLEAMKEKCQKEGRNPSAAEKAKARGLLGELTYLEPKVLTEVANSAKEGRGLRPDLKDNPWRKAYILFSRFFAN